MILDSVDSKWFIIFIPYIVHATWLIHPTACCMCIACIQLYANFKSYDPVKVLNHTARMRNTNRLFDG